MPIKVAEHWSEIRRVFAAAFSSSAHYAIASVDESGLPHVTPIGSVMLTSPCCGVFLQLFTTGLPRRIEHCDEVAILAVNSGRAFWIRSLIAGGFPTPPAVRLRVRITGEPRPPTEEEVDRFRRRVRFLRAFRGYDLMWREPGMARDFEVLHADPVRLGKMTHGHWA
ncbi:MAG: hypothetical protein WBG86_01690 [Polyangiales bacterium]